MSQTPSTSHDPGEAAGGATEGDEVAGLLAPLGGLDDRPVGDHVAAFEHVHRDLRQVLAGEGVTSAG